MLKCHVDLDFGTRESAPRLLARNDLVPVAGFQRARRLGVVAMNTTYLRTIGAILGSLHQPELFGCRGERACAQTPENYEPRIHCPDQINVF